jgi:hypothetical protein
MANRAARLQVALTASVALCLVAIALLIVGPRTLIRWLVLVVACCNCFVFFSLRRSETRAG